MTLQLEEVVRQHFGAQAQRPGEQDAALRRMRVEHLKARGDEELKQGNYRLAWERYGEALALAPDKAGQHALHANRSLAYLKAGRAADALDAADAAAAAAPAWPKAQWRRAAALLALRRVPDAVAAFAAAWRLDRGDAQTAAKLWATVQRLTREELARCVLRLLGSAQAEGQLEPPREEEASGEEQAEALFRHMRAAHQGQPRPGPYYRRYLRWLQEGLPAAEAYLERAAVHAGAKCYLQARADARAAIATLLRQQREAQQQQQADAAAQQPAAGSDPAAGSSSSPARSQLALAYQRLGEACLAERAHPDRDCRGAAKAFLRASELLGDAASGSGGAEAAGAPAAPSAQAVRDGLQEASEALTLEELEQVQVELYHEGPADGSEAHPASAGGGRLVPGQRLFRLAVRLAFPSATAAACSSRARELLRGGLAAAAGVDPRRVTIERIAAPSAARGQPWLEVQLHVAVGGELLKASDLAKALAAAQAAATPPAAEQLQAEAAASGAAPTAAAGSSAEQMAALLNGEALVAALGLPDPAACAWDIEDVTPACARGSEGEAAAAAAGARGELPPEQDRRLAHPARPKTEIEVPYRLYRLVRADGSPAERADKHPFCMSRVYYDASEKPEEVWAELADGSCRWRQTGGEVKVLALAVPADLPTRRLAVDIQPYSLKVWDRQSGEVYLQGELERGVVPEDCFWTHCGGGGEDGCALYLRKMNLELLQRHWMHSEMWWPRLFRGHAELAWDDYEKDYSDLPEEVLARHRVAEAIKDDERRAETGERERREALQERDDARKRARQERLNELRSGSRKAAHVLPAPAAAAS